MLKQTDSEAENGTLGNATISMPDDAQESEDTVEMEIPVQPEVSETKTEAESTDETKPEEDQKSENPEIPFSGNPDIKISGYRDLRISGDPKIRISGNPDIRNSVFPGIRIPSKSGSPDVRIKVTSTS